MNPKVDIALVPTAVSWEAPVYLGWGGWNDAPDAAQQLPIMKYWNEKYGAELVSATFDFIEMIVPNPPGETQDVIDLAFEHAAYSPDNIFQGAGGIDTYASGIADYNYWGFWWD